MITKSVKNGLSMAFFAMLSPFLTFLNPSPEDFTPIKRLLSSGEGLGRGAFHPL
jgi:hypothetical protein